MSSAARIEELQKKFDENPRRYFAPLANECRKAGDLEAAIAICRAHLPQQPGHMSGHIVYGQALFEAGELPEAKTVFETALGLDPENLIALRHLGDIAVRDGDPEGARQWYSRVLETDPRNEEIQALIGGLGASGAAPAPDLVAAPGATESVAEGLPTALDPELVAAAAEATEPDEVSEPAELDALELSMPGLEIGQTETTESEAAAGADTPREALLEPTSYEFEAPAIEPGRTLDGLETSSFEPPPRSVSASFDAISDEAMLDQEPPAAPQLDGLEPTEFDAGGFGATGLEPITAPSFEFEPPDAAPLQDPPSLEARADDATSEGGDAFVTETMAELYLRQGYNDQALAVYRQLVSQNPGDAELRERMELLERDMAAGIVGASPEPEPEAEELEEIGTIPGLPQAMEPALIDAAADAAEDDSLVDAAAGMVAQASPAGPTIRDFLAALALGGRSGDGVGTESGRSGDGVGTESGRSGDGVGTGWGRTPEPEAAGEIAEVVDVAVAVQQPLAEEPALGTPAFDEPATPAPAGTPGEVQGASLDALFGADVPPADVAAADTLASAFETPPEAPAGAAAAPHVDPLSGNPARPAAGDLSLDHVFGQPRPQGGGRTTGGFSFDQFFAEGAVRAPREEPPEPTAEAGDSEDLEQFNSWLHGLKNQ